MKLMSLKQFEKKSRGSLMRFINGYLKTQSKKQVAIFAYALAKSKLPRLPYEQTKTKMLRRYKKLKFTEEIPKPKKKKEKLTKAEKKRRQKKLSAINKWRVEQGMKKIVIK